MLVLVHDLAAIDPVAQHRIERAPGERLAAPAAARRACPRFAANAGAIELLLQQSHRAERGIAAEDVLDGFGFARDDDQLMVSAPVTEGRHPTHPHAFLLRGGDLVADALSGDLALELGEGEQNVQGQATHRGRRVELLRHRHEGAAFRIEDLDNLCEVGERTGQPVDLVADDDIDPPLLDVGQKLLKGRAVDRRARQPAIVVSLWEAGPAFVALALDIGFASLALGMQRIELLFQSLLGGFSGVDGTAPSPPAARSRLAHVCTAALPRPKKRGPDQCAPVILCAIWVREWWRSPSYSKPSSSTMTVCVFPPHSRSSRVPGLSNRAGANAPAPFASTSAASARSRRLIAGASPPWARSCIL